jgi:hypothetical protein
MKLKTIIIVCILIVSLLVLSIICVSIDNKNSPSVNPIEADDLVIAVSREAYLGYNYTYVFIDQNQTIYKVTTQGVGRFTGTLSGNDLVIAKQLLSIVEHDSSFDPPIALSYAKINDTAYSNLLEYISVVNFHNVSQTSNYSATDLPYYHVEIFLEEYKDQILYYWGEYPNIETKELTDFVLELI